MANKKKSSKLKYFVIFSIGIIITFTIAMIILFALFGTVPDTLITCFFATFGGEVLSCALIKIFKIRKEESNGTENY